MKRLYRSGEDRILAGVVGGLGEYFDIDPTLLRVVTLIIFVLTGFFPIAIIYILAILVMPRESEVPTVVDVEVE